MASTLLVWIKNITSLENLNTQIGISELSDYRLKDNENDVLYHLTKVVSYNQEEKSFELVLKRQQNWSGFAGGHEVNIESGDFKSVAPAIILNPVLLVYQFQVNSLNSKYDFNAEDENPGYSDEETKKQYEEDLKLAEELQQQMDEEEKSNPWDRK